MLAFSQSIFINQSIHSLVLHAFLFKDTLFNTYCSFINIELAANSTKLRPEWSLSNIIHCFLCETHHSLVMLRDTRQNFSIMNGVILNSEITKKNSHQKHKKCQNKVALNRPGTRHLIIAGTATRGRGLLCLTSAGNIISMMMGSLLPTMTQTCRHSVQVWEWPRKCPKYWPGGCK